MQQSRKQKLLQKYVEEVKTGPAGQPSAGRNSINMRDNDIFNRLSSSGSDSDQPAKRHRIHSSDDDQDNPPAKLQQDANKTDKKIYKKIRKALGIDNEAEINEFMKEVKIEGIDMHELSTFLKQHKQAKIEGAHPAAKDKKHRKEKKNKKHEQGVVKIEEGARMLGMYSSSESDLDIPEQSRTVYRNKDGSIREQSERQQQAMHEQKVLARLGEWEKGMKDEAGEEEEKDEDIARAKQIVWDDPIKRWDAGPLQKPFTCRFEGYGNRFSIKPGHRWDGVIRGNGFENKCLQEQILKKTTNNREQREYLKHL